MSEFKVETRVVSKETIAECIAKKIECRNYWDSHGRKVPYDPSVIEFDTPRKIELVEKVIEYVFPNAPSHTSTFWYLFADGEDLNIQGDVMRFKPFKTKLKVEVCVGTG